MIAENTLFAILFAVYFSSSGGKKTIQSIVCPVCNISEYSITLTMPDTSECWTILDLNIVVKYEFMSFNTLP